MRQGEGQEQGKQEREAEERGQRVAGGERQSDDAHLARLGESEWGMWRWVGLRAAGFSVEGVRRLGAEEAGRGAERPTR